MATRRVLGHPVDVLHHAQLLLGELPGEARIGLSIVFDALVEVAQQAKDGVTMRFDGGSVLFHTGQIAADGTDLLLAELAPSLRLRRVL